MTSIARERLATPSTWLGPELLRSDDWVRRLTAAQVVDLEVYQTFWFKPMVVLALTAGGVFLMWLGEQITEHGVGNGISRLIMAGIVARMPIPSEPGLPEALTMMLPYHRFPEQSDRPLLPPVSMARRRGFPSPTR